MRDRKKRNIIIGALCSLLVFMGIGYAVLSQALNISGTANMKGTWDIKITDISEASRTGKADPGTPTISSSGVSASFEANLWMPGDSITYNVTVKNNGNIDAALKELVPSVENGVQQVKFSNNAVQGKVLRQSESYTFQVSVVFDEDATEIPQDSKTNPPKYTISLTFVQYAGNSLYTPTNETTDNSCFVINTAGEITEYDYNCGTVVTVPAEIDGIKVKSIANGTFYDPNAIDAWEYSKEESADVTKTYYIFKDQEARSLYLEDVGITQEELDAEENTYNYLKSDKSLQGIDLGTLSNKYVICKIDDEFILTDDIDAASSVNNEVVPLTVLDLSHAEYLEAVELGFTINLKKLNLNTGKAFKGILGASEGAYGPINYNDSTNTKRAIGLLEEMVVNADVFTNISGLIPSTFIKQLIILDGKENHNLVPNSDENDIYSFLGPTPAGAETIIIGDGIKEIGAYAFSSFLVHPKISNLIIASSVETISNGAFIGNQLTSVTIPASVETIGTGAFSDNLLTTINFEPNSKLKTIGGTAFKSNKLTSVTIPASVETIGNNAFYKNDQLTTISFEPNSKLKTIGESAFKSNKLTSVTIPASVETIGGSAFDNNQITAINFEPNSKLKTIGSYTFAYNKLTSLTIPASVETIDNSAFSNNQITTINFESNSKLKTIDAHAFGNNQLTNTGLGKLPSSLTSLATTAFSNNPDLTKVTLTSPKDLAGWPNGLTVDGKTITYKR